MHPYVFNEDLECTYFVTVCGTCAQILVYEEYPSDGEPNGLFEAHLIWPKTGLLGASVPLAIRDIYKEAALIKHRAPNAFAGQIRSQQPS